MSPYVTLLHNGRRRFLVGDANDTAGRAGAGVASLEGLLVAALAEVVGAGVDNDGAADDALGANQLDEGVLDGALGVALAVGLDVAQVTDVAGLVGRGTVGLAVGVDWGVVSTVVRTRKGTGRARSRREEGPTVGTGRRAAVGVVTKGVDVEAALGVGVVAGQVVGDTGGGGLGVLLKGDGTRHLGITTNDSN